MFQIPDLSSYPELLAAITHSTGTCYVHPGNVPGNNQLSDIVDQRKTVPPAQRFGVLLSIVVLYRAESMQALIETCHTLSDSSWV